MSNKIATNNSFVLSDQKAIIKFFAENQMIAGTPKWSYQIAGTHCPWALLLESKEGLYNCFLKFEKKSIKNLTCDLYSNSK